MTGLVRFLFSLALFAGVALPLGAAQARDRHTAVTGSNTGSNTWPLAFGMTPQQVTDALGSPLVHVSGRPGNEVFVTYRDAGIPTLFRSEERLVLQFRGGRLSGWKTDWRGRPPPLLHVR